LKRNFCCDVSGLCALLLLLINKINMHSHHPFPSDRPHRLHSEFSGFLFVLVWHSELHYARPALIEIRTNPSALCYWRLNDPFCSERVTMHCQWGGKLPKIAVSRWGSAPHVIRLYMVPWAHPSPRPKRHVDRFSRFCTARRRVSHYCTVRHCVSPKNCLFHLGDRVPHLTHVPRAYPSHHPKRHLDRFSQFCVVPNAML